MATKPSPEALRKISAAWSQLREHAAIVPIRILNGKRAINARQAKALASRFSVSPAVFL